jgi:pimeloyl-ACP methyl ester carboxylesterase
VAALFGGVVNEVPETRFVRSADRTLLAYQVTGEGPVDFLWGGGGFTVDLMWDDPEVTRVSRRLSTFCRCIWFDLRGWGGSEGDILDSRGGYLSDADVMAVLDAVGSEKAVMVGWGTASCQAIHFAATHPERVSALVVINGFAYYVQEDDYPWGIAREDLDRAIAASFRVDGGSLAAPSRSSDAPYRTWASRSVRLGLGPDRFAQMLGPVSKKTYARFYPRSPSPPSSFIVRETASSTRVLAVTLPTTSKAPDSYCSPAMTM